MSDKELLKEIEIKTESVLEKQQQGSIIIWNKDFVEQLELFLPKVSYNIKQQMTPSENAIKEPISSITRASAGSNDQKWWAYGDNIVGIHLYALTCRIEWTWNQNNVITSVYPATSGETYYPGWTFDEVTGSTATFNASHSMCHKWSQGRFDYSLGGSSQTVSPSMDVYIYAGGSYSPASGEH